MRGILSRLEWMTTLDEAAIEQKNITPKLYQCHQQLVENSTITGY